MLNTLKLFFPYMIIDSCTSNFGGMIMTIITTAFYPQLQLNPVLNLSFYQIQLNISSQNQIIADIFCHLNKLSTKLGDMNAYNLDFIWKSNSAN